MEAMYPQSPEREYEYEMESPYPRFPEQEPEQPYGPGAICADCGHFAHRHNVAGCHFPRDADNLCGCEAMLWNGVRWPRPWLPAPDGLNKA